MLKLFLGWFLKKTDQATQFSVVEFIKSNNDDSILSYCYSNGMR